MMNQSYIITGSNPATFRDFINFVSSCLNLKTPGTVPEFLAKIALGKDPVKLLTKSMKASNKKIQKIYDFKFPCYQDGIQNVLNLK